MLNAGFKYDFSHPALEDSPEMEGKKVLTVDATYKVCDFCGGHGDINYPDEPHPCGHSQCPECDGKRVVPNFQLPEWAIKEIESYYDGWAESQRIESQERFMGA